MSEEIDAQKMKKAAVIALIRLDREAQTKSSKEIENEIREVLEESFTRIRGLVLENVIVT
jgi:hypothetical protein